LAKEKFEAQKNKEQQYRDAAIVKRKTDMTAQAIGKVENEKVKNLKNRSKFNIKQ
jgi:hypothetical protein